jgi:hypothetical protein
MLSFFESCSTDTLQNALWVFQKWGVIEAHKVVRPVEKMNKLHQIAAINEVRMRLVGPYNEDAKLQELVSRISQLRKPPPIRKNATRRALIADIPMLAKL